MSKRAEWEATQGERPTHVLEVGPVSAWVCPNWNATKAVYAFEVERGSATDVDHAKQLAEGKLREIRDALNEHFAPVLRWEEHATDSTLSVGPWLARAKASGWFLYLHGFELNRGAGDATEHADPRAAHMANRRAAEVALRALGVVFRTEGE